MFDLGGMNIDVSVEMGSVKGERGWYYEPHMTEDGTLTWTNNGGLENPQTVNIRGPVGKGFQIKATFATLEELEAVTDAESGDFFNVGTEAPYTIYLYDGKDFVSQGQLQGPTGEDGFAPTVSGVKENGVLTLTVTDKNGTQTYSVADGNDGIGKDGVDGEDGFSPVITVNKVEGATNLTVTTKEGTQTASIPDGAKGDKGDAGQTAYAAAQQGGYTGTEADFYADLAAMDGLANWFAAYSGGWKMSLETEKARLETAKSDISAALVEKGVTVPDGTKIDGMGSLIRSISASPDTFWATGTSTTISGLNFTPTQIWVFGYYATTKLRSGTYFVTLLNATYRWDSFSIASDGAVTRNNGGTGGTGYVTRDGYSDESTGTITNYSSTFTLTMNAVGSYTITTYKTSSYGYNCTAYRWFAFA